MKQLASVFATLVCLLLITNFGFAQNATVSIVPADFLYVCGQDTLTVNVANTGGGALNNVVVKVSLPSGVQYVPGTINGGTEQNISNLNEPLFDVASIGVGASKSLKLVVTANCEVIPAINSGQLFTDKATVTYTGGSDQVNSINYKIETGLAVIVSATPVTLAAEKDDMPLRTFVVRNTRLGPIQRLSFTDNHFGGMTGTIPGGTNESNGPVLFSSTLDGSFFANFGDGDNLFEFNEEITITEKLTITDCGTPSYDNPSRIRIGWGCDADICQYDSTDLEVTILPSSKNPDLRFTPIYGFPADYCADVSSYNQVVIGNIGGAEALNVQLDFYNGLFDIYTGMDPASFEYSNDDGATWVPLSPGVSSPFLLDACDVTYSSRNLVTIPEVPANDTVLLRYKMFTCFPACNQTLIPPYFFVFYQKPCPEGATVSDSVGFTIDSTLSTIRQLTRFDIKECIVEGESYDFNFTAKSARFLTDTTYMQARIILPLGMMWDSTCVPPTIEGKSPVYTSSEVDPNTGTTTIVLTFELPFTSDSINMPFCLKFVCVPDLPCMETLGMISQSGGVSTAYPVVCGDQQCGLKTTTQASITFTPDADEGCGMTGCHLFMLNVLNHCGDGGGGAGGGIPAGLLVDYKTYRINYGLIDEDDNRVADDTAPPVLNQIRLDRYIPGDTLRFELKGVVLFGEIPDFPLQINTEVLASDFGLLDGDAFNLMPGRTTFTNKDSLATIRAHLRVKRVDGTEYECTLPETDYKHQNLINMEAVNIQPPQNIDRFLTMYKTHLVGAVSCSPDGVGPMTGDSVFFTYEYQFRVNFAPQRAGGPPPALINFRNVPWNRDYAWTYPDSIGWPRPMSQYSGYVIGRTFPKHTIKPCETSAQLNPFSYNIRIARGNMFPYEVRQIAQLEELEYRIAPDATLLSALTDFTLQEGVTWATDDATPYTNVGLDFTFDYANSLFDEPIDEGFTVRTDYLFDESCVFLGPDTSQVAFTATYPEAFPNATQIQYFRRDGTGFLDAAPLLDADFAQNSLNMSSEEFDLAFVLKNARPAEAPNAWMYVEPLNGTLSDVELINDLTGVPYPSLAGLYQLGTIPLFYQQSLRIKGKNSNCEGLKLRLIFGWDCDPVTNPFASTCGRDTVLLDLRLQNAVLELDVINQPSEVPLCEPSDFFTFEVSNANDGNGLGIVASVKLPQGLTVVPGSAQVQYPSPGGTWVTIPDPSTAAGNIYLWEMLDILPALTTGLPGFNNAPNNAFRIRFRTLAECGFVANAQPVYGVDGIQPCGSLTNSLRKPDEPIQLEGVSPAYGVVVALSPASTDPISCGEDFEIAVQLLLEGSPAAGDSVYITLPAGVNYVAGSYEAIQNAPANGPQQIGQTLQLGFNSGLVAGNVVKFNIKVSYDQTASCLDKFITAQTRQKINGFCVITNQSCGVYLATGEALLQVPSTNPDLKLAEFSPSVGVSGSLTFEAVLENPGTVTAPSAVLQLWVDQNGNGVPDGSDQLIQTINYTQPIAPGQLATQTGNLNVPLADLCKLLAVLPAQENCACIPKYFPIEGLVVNQGTLARCAVEPVTFGVPNTAGHTYTWQPTNSLSCNNCSETTFTPDPSVQNGDFFTYVLLEQSGGCTIEHRFEIRFGEALGINTPDQTVCKGDTVVLQASPGGTYQWAGPGVNPTAANQILAPTSSSTYSVTVTLAAGCTGTDVVNVTVLEPSNLQLPPVTGCVGTPVVLFGEPRTASGEYCKTYPKANGCDSTVCITLTLLPVEGVSNLSACQGDSVEVFPDQFESTSGQYCKTFQNAAGCDSTHCVTLNFVPKPNLGQDPTKITVSKDSSVTLTAVAGFNTYAWEPSQGLSCTDCQITVATPDPVEPLRYVDYSVIVSNGGACVDTAYYRLYVAPPCFEDVPNYVPNAFTPGNDDVNNVFKLALPEEGFFEKVYRLQVYNRWGQKIYDSTTNPIWDGNVGGKPAPMDVYIFIMDVECNGEIRRLSEREVTLIR